LGKEATVDEALQYARKCREAGLVHMVGRFSGDLRWLNEEVGPIEELVTICNCCPCCCAMRLVPHLDHNLSTKFLSRMPGVEVTVSEDCSGCGLCTEDAIQITVADLEYAEKTIQQLNKRVKYT
jgi:hypothetical protein